MVKDGMKGVVNEPRGTAYSNAHSEKVSISGKTGSAQSGTGGADHAWFIAYAPSDTPSLAMGILVEHGLHGASAASPWPRPWRKCCSKPAANQTRQNRRGQMYIDKRRLYHLDWYLILNGLAILFVGMVNLISASQIHRRRALQPPHKADGRLLS